MDVTHYVPRIDRTACGLTDWKWGDVRKESATCPMCRMIVHKAVVGEIIDRIHKYLHPDNEQYGEIVLSREQVNTLRHDMTVLASYIQTR